MCVCVFLSNTTKRTKESRGLSIRNTLEEHRLLQIKEGNRPLQHTSTEGWCFVGGFGGIDVYQSDHKEKIILH